MKKLRRAIAAAAGLVLLSGSGVAIWSGTSSGATGTTAPDIRTVATGTVTIGLTDDFSQAEAVYGKVNKLAWQATINRVNKAGGIHGRKLKLVALDNQESPASAISDVKQLTSDGAIAISGLTDTGQCSAAINADTSSTPVSCAAMSLSQLSPTTLDAFSRAPVEAQYVTGVLKFLGGQLGKGVKPQIALLPVDLPGELEWAAQFQKETPRVGGKVVTDQQISYTSLSDVTSQVAATLAAKPNVVVAEIAPSGLTAIDTGLRNGGFTGTIVNLTSDYSSMSSIQDPKLFEVSTNLIVSPSAARNGAQQYIRDMATVGVKGTVNLNSVTTVDDYLAANLTVQALQSCDLCTGKALADRMQSTLSLSGVTTTGGFGYTAQSHQPLKTIALYQSAKTPKLVTMLPLTPLSGL